MKIKVQTYYIKFAEQYFVAVNQTACNNNGIELPAEMRNLPNLRQVYADALQQGNHDKSYYFNANHLGSGSLITDGGGNTYQTLAYAPWGESLVNITHSGSGSYDEPYKFTGFIRDSESGLDQAKARYRDPVTDITLSTDPHWYNYPHLSSYVWCGNNPINAIDPSGEDIKVWYVDENNKPQTWIFNGTNQNDAPNNEFVNQFITAYFYDINNGGGDNLKAAAEATDYTLNLVKTEGGSSFQLTFPESGGTEGTVFWNPYQGLELDNGRGTLSPATLLEHEMDHGVHWETKTEEHIKYKISVHFFVFTLFTHI
jgi:RHS repeat-associated protein